MAQYGSPPRYASQLESAHAPRGFEKRTANYRATVLIDALVMWLTSAISEALPEKRRVQVVEKEPLDELTPAAHADLLEDTTQMVLDGVLGDK